MNGKLALHPKTAAAGIGGAGLGGVIVWILGLAHVPVDPVVAAELAAGLGMLASWLAPLIQKEADK